MIEIILRPKGIDQPIFLIVNPTNTSQQRKIIHGTRGFTAHHAF